jgi:hypothetical protein
MRWTLFQVMTVIMLNYGCKGFLHAMVDDGDAPEY